MVRNSQNGHNAVVVGISKLHSSMVYLVLNLDTGNVSPQYQVVFDDNFTTVLYFERC